MKQTFDAIAAFLAIEEIDETGAIESDDLPLRDGVALEPRDVRSVQLAKAAIAAGVQVLLNEAGLEYDQVSELCLAGGFGNYIDRESAADIGLLPEEMRGKIRPVGNAAGTGARMMLKNRTKSASADALCGKMRYVELSARADFQNLFVEKMMFGEEDW